MTLEDVLFVGFNRRVAAIDKQSGEILWQWKSPAGTGFVSLLLEYDRLFVAVQGHVYCLDATDGRQIWTNPMKGFGFGVTSLASTTGRTPDPLVGEAAAQAQAAAAAAAS